ncbi:MAG TPA: hypothetical protein VK988_18485, partial [Acidimicrobiales bacterium]|nr:hypothetical protein [Acidimicrobiales bacterium]
MATGKARAATRAGGSIVFAVAMAVGLWSSAALAAGNGAASSASTDGVVLLPEEDGPYELVRDDPYDDEDDAWDEEDEAVEEDAEEDADEGEAVIGEGVQHSSLVRGRGRASGPSRAPAGSQPMAVPVTAAGTALAPTPGPPAARVLGTHLERPTGLAVPPADLLAAPAGRITGYSSLSATDQRPAGSTFVAALLALGVLGAGGAL